MVGHISDEAIFCLPLFKVRSPWSTFMTGRMFNPRIPFKINPSKTKLQQWKLGSFFGKTINASKTDLHFPFSMHERIKTERLAMSISLTFRNQIFLFGFINLELIISLYRMKVKILTNELLKAVLKCIFSEVEKYK